MAKRDVLDEMSKQDLIDWIRKQFFALLPKRSEVLYMRWERQSAQVLEEMQRENRALDCVDFKERDRFAAQFRESRDANEKLRLLKLIEPYGKALPDHIRRSKAIDAKQMRVDALYKRIEVTRQAEP